MSKPVNDPLTNEMTTAEPVAGQTAEQASPEQESAGSVVHRHPVAFIAGGVALGLIAGALLPRGTGRKLAKGAVAAAATVGQAGLQFSHHARDTAEDLSREGRDAFERNSAVAQRRAAELAENARHTGSRLVEQAVELASRVRR